MGEVNIEINCIKCGKNVWRVQLIENTLILTCVECGNVLSFYVSFPLLNILEHFWKKQEEEQKLKH